MTWQKRLATALILLGCSFNYLCLRLAGWLHPGYSHYERRLTDLEYQ